MFFLFYSHTHSHTHIPDLQGVDDVDTDGADKEDDLASTPREVHGYVVKN